MTEPETPAVTWTAGADPVAISQLRRPPNNFFSLHLIDGVPDALFAIDDDPGCRAAVLCAEGLVVLAVRRGRPCRGRRPARSDRH